ncbi:MAG: PKD domain-containing protein, partial [Anaerolineae bacterium]|nr:PKD domain-containing protein [Anaerolineae bacterium]
MNIQRIWARGFPLFLSILFLLMLSACNLGATDEQQINVTDVPQQTQNAIQASPSPNQPTRTPSGVVVLPTPQTIPTSQLPPTFSFRPPQPIIPTLTALPVNVFILSPIPGNVVAGNVQVIGAAMHPEFLQYQLEYGPDPNPSNLWYPITGGVQSPVFNGLLGIWNTNTTNSPDGLYQLRLRVFLRNGVDWGNVVVNNIRIQNRVPLPVPTNTQVPAPIAAFTQDKVTGIAPLTVNFINLSSPANLITGFTWNFGDNTTSTQISPVKTFNNPGTYTVTLTATGPGGSSNVSRQITVQSANPPVAGFTTDKTTGSAPLTVQFTNASTGGQVSNYLWNFSDGTTSTEQNPSHQFTNVGTYNVILTVSGPGGSSSATRQITVGNPIQASIQATPDTNNPLRINLVATVTGGSGTYTAYDWDFGNGQTLFGQVTPNASVTYASANTYTITLTVTDSTGAKKTVTQPVTLQAPPDPLAGDFTITQTNSTDLAVGFSATATGGSGVYTYTWDFGDSNTGNGEAVNHNYGTAGTYDVTLTISDGADTTTVTKQVTIDPVQQIPPLSADFTITHANPTDMNIGVDATATGGSGSYTYSWNFGDTNTGSGQSTTHVYGTTGTFTITLTVNDGANDAIVTKDVTINALPPLTGDFTITQASPTDPNIGVSATASGGTGNYTYSWDFGDGGIGSDQVTNHTYTGTGTFTITLTISDGATTFPVIKEVTINALPPLTGDFTITQA